MVYRVSSGFKWLRKGATGVGTAFAEGKLRKLRTLSHRYRTEHTQGEKFL